jgi:hypothetical protein
MPHQIIHLFSDLSRLMGVLGIQQVAILVAPRRIFSPRLNLLAVLAIGPITPFL